MGSGDSSPLQVPGEIGRKSKQQPTDASTSARSEISSANLFSLATKISDRFEMQ